MTTRNVIPRAIVLPAPSLRRSLARKELEAIRAIDGLHERRKERKKDMLSRPPLPPPPPPLRNSSNVIHSLGRAAAAATGGTGTGTGSGGSGAITGLL